MSSEKGISEIISVILIMLVTVSLVGTAFMYGMPLINKRQDTSSVDRAYNNFDSENANSLVRKIEFVAKNGGQETFTSSVGGAYKLSRIFQPHDFQIDLPVIGWGNYISIPISEGLEFNELKSECGYAQAIYREVVGGQATDVSSGDTLEAGKGHDVLVLGECSFIISGIPYSFGDFEITGPASGNMYWVGAPYKTVGVSDVLGNDLDDCKIDDLTVLDSENNPTDTLYPGEMYLVGKISGGSCTFGQEIVETSYNSLKFTTFSKVSNIAISSVDSDIGWVALTTGGSCPPNNGIVGIDSPYVICAKAEPFSDGYNIIYRIWLRDLYDSTETKIWRMNFVKHESGQTSSSTKTVRISRGDVTTGTEDGKTLITTEVKILLV